MKRLIKKANNLTEEQEKFIKECEESGKFNEDQMDEIREGFEKGLTMEQVKFYADPKFNDFQMYEIKWGFEIGLTLEQIELYTDPKFDWEQMDEIKYDFKNGLTTEQLKFMQFLNLILNG